MYKLAAFDLDGTVADTLSDLAASVNYALSLHGIPAHPDDDYRYFVGNGVDVLIKKAMADRYTSELAAEVKAEFSSYYASHTLDYTRAYSGMAELLEELSDSGIMTAVISNKPDAYVPEILGTLYPRHKFDCISGQLPDVPRKPAPDALVRLMKRLELDPDDVLYIGDSDVDVVFAHSAGVKVCGVSWGFRGADELRSAGADYIADTVDELRGVIYE